MESTATFIIISVLLCFVLVVLIFMVLKSFNKSKNSKKNVAKKTPNIPYIKNIKKENGKIYGVIFIIKEEHFFEYKKSDYAIIQKEITKVKNSLAILMQTSYKDIIKTRQNAILASFKVVVKSSTLSNESFLQIKSELNELCNSIAN